MRKSRHNRHLRLIAAVAVLLTPLSAFGESRPSTGTQLERLAEDLARVFGRDAVSIERAGSSRHPLPRRDEDIEQRTAGVTSDVHDALAAMNLERSRQGLHPLRLNTALVSAASMKVDDMHRQRYFDHVGPDGRRPVDFARAAGYRYSMLGENLAAGFSSGDAVVDAWMRSPGHRANILGAYSEVGIASLDGSPVRGYGGDTWVAIYGTR